MGKVATSPLPSRGSPPLQSGGGNQKWPPCGQSGYVTPAVSGIPSAAERGGKSEVAHKWAKWLRHPCRLGDPHRCRAGGKSEVAHLWAKWLRHPCRLRDPHRCTAGGGNQKWPTCGQRGYVTPAVSGIPTAAERGGEIRSGPLVGKVATSPLPSRGSPPLQSGGGNQKWPTNGQSGYVTPAVSGIPTAAERGGKSEVAHLWAKWLRHPCRLGDPHRCRAGGEISSGPLMGKVATSPLPSRGSPPLQSGGGKSEVAHKWAKWLRHPCRLGDPHRCRAGGEIRSGPLVGKMATSPLPSRGSPPLQSVGGNQKWPTNGQSGYVTPAASGIPTAAERGGKSEVAHLWAKWLRHPCRLGDPHRFRAGGGKSQVAHKWAKWLRHPCRLGDPHRCRAGGRNQKWPTCGQSGYVTPAALGIPTAAQRGGTSEVAHKWAKWLRHPCRLGDPHRFRAGGGNQKWPTNGQSGYVTPAVSGIPTAAERGGKSEVAHLWAKWLRHPCRLGDPHRFRAGGGNQKWPTNGQSGYVTRAVSGIPTAAERGGKSEVAHLWAKWLRHPCRLGDPHRFRAGGKSEVAHLWAKWLRHPCRLGDPHRCRAGGEIRSGPLVGKVATSPLPPRGSPPLHSGGGNQKWPTCGQSGYVTPAVSGIPTASERGGKSEVANKWAKWLRHPCRLGDPKCCRAGGEIRGGPQVGKVATSPLPSRGSPPLQSGGKIRSGPLVGKVATSPMPSQGSPPLHSGGGNQKWPTCGQRGYVTPAVSGIPTAAERGGEIRSGPLVGKVATSPLPSRGSPPLQSGGGNQKWPTNGQSGYVTPAVSGIPTAAERGGKSEVAHLWAKWLRHPCRLGDPHRCRAGGEIRSGPLMGKVATSPLPSRGSPPLQSGGEESEVAHKWAKWLRHPCRLGDPHRCRAGGEIRSGPLVGKVATSPLPSRGSPPLQSVGGNQKWPTNGQSGYVTPAVSGIPTAAERGGKSEVAHLWAKWLRHPCRLGDPHRFRAGGEIRSGPLMGKVATSPLPSRGFPSLQSRGGKSEVAHLWANWLRHPCRLGDPHRCTAGGNIRGGPQVGKVATSPLPSRGSPPLQSGGGKSEVAHKWAKWLRHPCRLGDPHRCKAGGEIRSGPLVGKVATSPLPSRGSPALQSGGGKSEVAHKWAKWLRHPCRLGDPHRCTAGGEIRSGPLVGKVATSPLPPRGSPPLHSGGGNQKWPTCGQSGYVTHAVSGIPTAAERGVKSEVAHKWATWLRHPCRLGDRHRCRAGGEIRLGPLVGKVATSPLPSRGSPPLQSGGEN